MARCWPGMRCGFCDPGTVARGGGTPAETDQREARALSEVSCRIDVPSVHVPSRQARHGPYPDQ